MHHYESLSRNVPGFVGIFVSKVRLIKEARVSILEGSR